MFLRSAILALTAAAASFAADPGLMSLVPADATVVAGVHVDRSVNSPFGQYVLQQMQENSGNKDFQTFIAATGFDPRRDLVEVITCTAATSNSHGLVLARGTFDTAKIQAAAKAQGASFTNYRDVFIITGKTPDNGWVGFPDSRTALLGDPASVKA